jgi:ABC-type phosphate/phosphonate transport system substrate-binding protein
VTRFLLTAVLAAVVCPFATAGDKDVYHIGIPRSVFRDVPPALLSFAGEPLKDLMKAQTGLNGQVVNEPDAMTVAQDIDSGKLQLGVLLGHELAWARQKYPNLEVIVCSVPRPREIQAFILVRHDSKAANLGDLKGAKLTMATGTRDHARLYFERRRAEEMGSGSFGGTEKTSTVHESLHKVIDCEADATVADSASWNYFQKLYPGRSQNLRVLSQSELFPATAIVYKKGALDDSKVKAIREGLMTAHENSRCAKLMNLIRIERFDAVPSGYEDMLKASLKAYPAPLSEK